METGRYRTNEISSKNVYLPTAAEATKNEESGWFDWLHREKSGSGPNAEGLEYSETNSPSKKAATMFRPPDEDGWGNDNWWLADDPGNQTGNPPGTSPDAGAGNGNFQLSAPVVALPGRGIDLNLSLYYNSRLWTKSGNKMIYDADKGFPAPGWSLGFGKMVFMGTNGGCMMIDADGTRHGYTGSTSTYTYGSTTSTTFNGHTADGTFIDYNCYYSSKTSGKTLSGAVSLPNGTKITYTSSTVTADQAFPTRITDAQGNYITITYRNGRGPELQTVTDTMGRVITFNYDSSNRLISVDVPKFDSSTTRTAVRLHYKQHTINAGFAPGITKDTATNTPQVIDGIYYPGTNTGYWFNETDSYSSYGMIAKVREMRGMSWSGTAGTQGTIVKGTLPESKEAVYDYPLTPDYSLTDAPTYDTLTESWAGMNTAPAVTAYAFNNNTTHHDGTSNSPARSITITQPNGLISSQYSYRTPGAWTDGLIFADETIEMVNSAPVTISSSLTSWQQGNYDSPRPSWTKVTDELGQTLRTTYTYGTNYNQLISAKEYDYKDILIRDTKTTFENSSTYTNAGRHIFNLVTRTEIVKVENNTEITLARTDYEYDNAPLADTPGVIMYDRTYDPNTPTWCEDCGACLEYYNYECESRVEI